MSDKLLNERELNFQLYEMLDTEALLERPRYAEHDRAVCVLHVEFVRLLTGADTRLTRSLLRGESACTYRVRPHEIAAKDRIPVTN